MPRKLRLNSLSRYSKKSARLILEEYSHCEIPAGCGGVVLRWIDPREKVYFNLERVICGSYEIFLDGDPPPKYSTPNLEYGEHVLTFIISEFRADYGVLVCAGIYDDKKLAFFSAPDGSWKYSLDEPSDNSWRYQGFDDSTWSSMIVRELPGFDPYQVRKLRDLGASELGIEETRTEGILWVRKTFVLSRERET